MLLSFSSVVMFLLFAPALVRAGPNRRPSASDDSAVRLRTGTRRFANTTYSGFMAADLDTEAKYVVTGSENQKKSFHKVRGSYIVHSSESRRRRFSPDMIWNRGSSPPVFCQCRIVTGRTPFSEQRLGSTGMHRRANPTSRLQLRTMHTSTALLLLRSGTNPPTSRLRSTRPGPTPPREGRGTTRANRPYSIWTRQAER